MTATTGSDPHPDVTEIADLAEDLLPVDRAADVRRHLADCAVCTETLDCLAEIRATLGTLPGPQRMPDDVAGRIDAALAAEALLDATSAPHAPHVPRGTSPAGETAASAAASVPAQATARESASGTVAESAPPSVDVHVPRGTSHWGRWLLVAAASIAVVVLGGLIAHLSGGDTTRSSDASGAKQDSAASAPQDPVAAQVRTLLDPSADQAPSTASGKGGASPNIPMLGGKEHTQVVGPNGVGTAVPACVLAAIDSTARPLAAQHENYEGDDAYLVVLPHEGDGTQVDAFVVNAVCTSTRPSQVLFERTYPRP